MTIRTGSAQQDRIQKGAQQWQKKLMTKAHQWEMSDLIAAGLNPILTATGGSPGSYSSPTPGPGASDLAEIGQAVERGTSSAKQSYQMKPQVDLLKQQTQLAKKTGNKYQAEEQNTKHYNDILAVTKDDHRMKAFYDQNSAKYQMVQNRIGAENMTIQQALQNALIPQAAAKQAFYKSWAGKGLTWWSEALKNIAGPLNFSGSASATPPKTTIIKK